MNKNIRFARLTEVINDIAVTYEVHKEEKYWSVLVILDGDVCDLSLSDIKVNLLDDNSRAFETIANEYDIGELPEVALNGEVSYFKFSDFKLSKSNPCSISIELPGKGCVIPLACQEDVIESEKEFEQDILIDDKKGGEKKVKADVCAVDTFVTPTGTQKNFTKYSVGRTHVLLMPEAWKIKATFKKVKGNKCKLCEYRQELKGEMTASRAGGKPFDISKPLDYKVVVVRERRQLQPVMLKKATYTEDGEGNQRSPGNPDSQYGYKPSHNPLNEAYSDDECYYWCIDTPFLQARVVKGTVINIEITFKGKIIDTAKKADVISKEWKWVLNKKL